MSIRHNKKIDTLFDIAVVIPTIVRASLLTAVRSIYKQNFTGTVQILIGVDTVKEEISLLDDLLEDCPENITVTVFDPGYSTSTRHGGVHQAPYDGGAIRTILTFLAHSPLVAYLDDDNSWHENHLTSLAKAIVGADWAFSYRWLIDDETGRKVSVDKWHSVGPGPDKGIGFCDPNTLMINKMNCLDILHVWSHSETSLVDRPFYAALARKKRGRSSNKVTVYYRIRSDNILWKPILQEFKARQEATEPKT
ncbi:MAG: hypothetical protein MI743_21540 [Sneathiellales bacterium]|nr:hypothetical protein [Sneathiellales bacterium]